MRARILPPEEWGRLESTQLPQIAPTMRPEDVRIVVVEDGDEIVSTVAVLRVTHLESLWIDPRYRGNAGTNRALLRKAMETVREWSDRWVWGCCDTGRMSSILRRLGGVPLSSVKSYILPVGRG